MQKFFAVLCAGLLLLAVGEVNAFINLGMCLSMNAGNFWAEANHQPQSLGQLLGWMLIGVIFLCGMVSALLSNMYREENLRSLGKL